MTTPYVPSATGAPGLSQDLPDDGDTANAASVDVPFEELADDLSKIANGGMVQQAINRLVNHCFWTPASAGETQVWTFDGDGLVNLSYVQLSLVSGSLSLWFPLAIPDGAQLTSVSAYLKGAGSHSALPATMPKLELFKQSDNGSGPSRSTIFSVTDTSSSAANYDLHHVVSSTGLTVGIQRGTQVYYGRITGEAGANALAGLRVHQISYSFLTGNAADRGAA